MLKNIDDLFDYEMVTEYDVNNYNAIPGTIKIRIKTTDDGIVDIPETINGLPVTCLQTMFGFYKHIKKLIIPKTLVTIDKISAFPQKVDELIIDENNPNFSADGVSLLSKDRKKLLQMCQENRKSYQIPNGVTTISQDALSYARYAVEITIPSTVTDIAHNAFQSCKALKCLKVDDNNINYSTDGVSLLSKDGKKLLEMCAKGIDSYSIPNGVEVICCRAFENKDIVELTIPDSVTTIEKYAFDKCSYLKNVYGGKNIENCGSHSFSDTAWFKKSPTLILNTVLLRWNTKDKNIVVPEGIEIIGSEAFYSSDIRGNICTESITLPSSVKEIGESAFCAMRNLKTINFPSGLTTIKDRAFMGCHSLAEIVLPNSISEIGRKAFSNCISLTKVVIPHAVLGIKTDSVIRETLENGVISAELFSGCDSLEHFEIPEDTVAIGNSAFNCCKKLKSIHIPDTVKSIGKMAFRYCVDLEELFLPAACVEFGQNALSHAATGWKVDPAKLSRIDVDPSNKVFSSLEGILCSKDKKTLIACPAQYDATDYTIPEGIKKISNSAFEGCEKIKKITFAQSVEKIETRAFASMPALEEIVLPKDFSCLEDEVFEGCTNLKSITWPDNIRVIGKKCFSASGIKKLIIPETVEEIDMYAFANIKAKKVRLPKTVKSISLSIFAGLPEIKVYDTIDSEAKPAKEYLSNTNGIFNARVGCIGIYQKEGCSPAACDAHWYEHTIIVRSSEDDFEKYRVRMPIGQKREVYCTYASSWGKNAEFNFCAIDDIFEDLTPDAKLDYVFNRLHWQEGISEKMLDSLKKYVSENRDEITERIFKKDTIDELGMFAPFGIIKKNNIDEIIDAATNAKAKKCTAWLLDWKNSNLTVNEKSLKANREKKR